MRNKLIAAISITLSHHFLISNAAAQGAWNIQPMYGLCEYSPPSETRVSRCSTYAHVWSSQKAEAYKCWAYFYPKPNERVEINCIKYSLPITGNLTIAGPILTGSERVGTNPSDNARYEKADNYFWAAGSELSSLLMCWGIYPKICNTSPPTVKQEPK